MPEWRTRIRKQEETGDATVWIDDDQAVIVEGGAAGREAIQQIDRGPGESRPAFQLRTIREIVYRDRLFVSGSAHARIGFERAYVAVTHRPDRLADGTRSAPATPIVRRTD